jgi:hypothetical protein
MRQKLTLIVLSLALSTRGFSQDFDEPKRCRTGEAAGYASRDATVLSMMGWGIGIAIGIAVLCALIENNRSDTATTSTAANTAATTTP